MIQSLDLFKSVIVLFSFLFQLLQLSEERLPIRSGRSPLQPFQAGSRYALRRTNGALGRYNDKHNIPLNSPPDTDSSVQRKPRHWRQDAQPPVNRSAASSLRQLQPQSVRPPQRTQQRTPVPARHRYVVDASSLEHGQDGERTERQPTGNVSQGCDKTSARTLEQPSGPLVQRPASVEEAEETRAQSERKPVRRFGSTLLERSTEDNELQTSVEENGECFAQAEVEADSEPADSDLRSGDCFQSTCGVPLPLGLFPARREAVLEHRGHADRGSLVRRGCLQLHHVHRHLRRICTGKSNIDLTNTARRLIILFSSF